MNCRFLLAPAILWLAGCSSSGENDSLAREKASMESEAKTLAAHQPTPGTKVEPPAMPKTKADPAGQPSGSRLPAGTPIHIVISQALSTRTAATGDVWDGKLSEDLKDAAGNVIAQAGSAVKGRVVLTSDGTNIRRKREIEIRLYQIQPVSGQPIDVHTISYIREGPDGGAKPAIIESNTQLDFRLASAMQIL